MLKISINVAKNFSPLPAGRTKSDNAYSGEHFRDILAGYLQQSQNSIIEVHFNGVLGAGSCFLDEAFGGLIRDRIITHDDFHRRIKIVANKHPEIAEKINRYVRKHRFL